MDLIRTELKFLITLDEDHKLRNQLKLAMSTDTHNDASLGGYRIKSIYFDDFYDSRVQEKADGVEPIRNIAGVAQVVLLSFRDDYVL